MSRLIDVLSEFLAQRKGLLPLFGCLLVVCNFFLSAFAPGAWLASTNLLLHAGVLAAVVGLLLARVL